MRGLWRSKPGFATFGRWLRRLGRRVSRGWRKSSGNSKSGQNQRERTQIRRRSPNYSVSSASNVGMLVETGGQGAKGRSGGDRREVARLLWHVEDGADSRLGGGRRYIYTMVATLRSLERRTGGVSFRVAL